MPTTVTRTVTLYTLEELKEANPRAYETVHDRWRGLQAELWAWEEPHRSIEALIDAMNAHLDDCELDLYGYSYVSLSFPHQGDYDSPVEFMCGKRALAWWENNVLTPLRVAWAPLSQSKQRRKYARYGSEYRCGKVPPCPLTGMCYDDVLLEHTMQALKRGCWLQNAVNVAIEELMIVLRDESEERNSEEAMLESWGEGGWDERTYLINGDEDKGE